MNFVVEGLFLTPSCRCFLCFSPADKRLNYFFIGSFERLIHFNPGVLWQAQALQRKMMEAALGVPYWERKMEQFRLIRADLGIKLL